MVGGMCYILFAAAHSTTNEIKYISNYYLNITILPQVHKVDTPVPSSRGDNGPLIFQMRGTVFGESTPPDCSFQRLGRRLQQPGSLDSADSPVYDPTLLKHTTEVSTADEGRMQNNRFTRYYPAATRHLPAG